jgi:hypothetical protein
MTSNIWSLNQIKRQPLDHSNHIVNSCLLKYLIDLALKIWPQKFHNWAPKIRRPGFVELPARGVGRPWSRRHNIIFCILGSSNHKTIIFRLLESTGHNIIQVLDSISFKGHQVGAKYFTSKEQWGLKRSFQLCFTSKGHQVGTK